MFQITQIENERDHQIFIIYLIKQKNKGVGSIRVSVFQFLK
jgi:hypothetical protein